MIKMRAYTFPFQNVHQNNSQNWEILLMHYQETALQTPVERPKADNPSLIYIPLNNLKSNELQQKNIFVVTASAMSASIDDATNTIYAYGHSKDGSLYFLKAHSTGNISLPMCWMEVDELDATDKRMLEAIINHFNGGPVGIESIASSIGEEATTIEDVIIQVICYRLFYNPTITVAHQVNSSGFRRTN